MDKTLKNFVDIFLGVMVAILLICYLISNINQYYMLTFFAIPIGIHMLRIYFETKKSDQLRKITFTKYLFVCLLSTQTILALLFPEINHFYIRADRVIFPLLYHKPVEFTYWWLIIIWMLLSLIKNKMLSMSLSITIFIAWLLVYNLW